MIHRDFTKWYACGLALSMITTASYAKEKTIRNEAPVKKPNILVVLCDDLGYSDVGFNGSKDIITPQIDRLANTGTIFTSAYVSHPFCGPSRASILTGRYPQCIGAQFNLKDDGSRTDDGVPVSETFMSNVLHDAGYYTAAIGKWHLGFSTRFQPNHRGFDEFYGFLAGGHDYFPDKFGPAYLQQKKSGKLPIREYITPLLHNEQEVEETQYLTDAFSRETVRIVTESAKKKQPFFIYLAYNAPHVPLQAKAEDLKKFESIKNKDRQTYAAMVYAVDRGVGEIVKALKANGQFENTLIVFLSDNGGNIDHGANNDPLKGTKGDTWEGGYRVPMFFLWPKSIPAGQHFDYPVSALDLYPTFAHLAKAKIPENKILDGKDIFESVQNGQNPRENQPIFALRYRFGYCDVGAREGDWKALRMGNEPWQLFNVKEDIGEHHDLSGRFPEKLRELVAKTEEWSKTHGKPLWYYTIGDKEMWDNGQMPNYSQTFEISKWILSPSSD